MAKYTISDSGECFAVKQGAIIISTHTTRELALGAIRRRYHQARRAAFKRRNCMTCRRSFMSEGSHNRMCGVCRSRTHYDGSA